MKYAIAIVAGIATIAAAAVYVYTRDDVSEPAAEEPVEGVADPVVEEPEAVV